MTSLLGTLNTEVSHISHWYVDVCECLYVCVWAPARDVI